MDYKLGTVLYRNIECCEDEKHSSTLEIKKAYPRDFKTSAPTSYSKKTENNTNYNKITAQEHTVMLHGTYKAYNENEPCCVFKTKCYQYEAMLQRIRSLLEEIRAIKNNEATGMCEFCKRYNTTGKCKRCEILSNRFGIRSDREKEERQKRFNIWLFKVKQFLYMILEREICKHKFYHGDSCERNELKNLLHELKSPLNIREPYIGHFNSIDSLENITESKDILEEVLMKLKAEKLYPSVACTAAHPLFKPTITTEDSLYNSTAANIPLHPLCADRAYCNSHFASSKYPASVIRSPIKPSTTAIGVPCPSSCKYFHGKKLQDIPEENKKPTQTDNQAEKYAKMKAQLNDKSNKSGVISNEQIESKTQKNYNLRQNEDKQKTISSDKTKAELLRKEKSGTTRNKSVTKNIGSEKRAQDSSFGLTKSKVGSEASKKSSPQAPKDSNSQAPNKSNQQAPNKSNQQAPNKSNQQAPNKSNQQAPNKSNQQAPKESNPQAPNKSSPQAPKESNSQVPKDSKLKTTSEKPKNRSENELMNMLMKSAAKKEEKGQKEAKKLEKPFHLPNIEEIQVIQRKLPKKVVEEIVSESFIECDIKNEEPTEMIKGVTIVPIESRSVPDTGFVKPLFFNLKVEIGNDDSEELSSITTIGTAKPKKIKSKTELQQKPGKRYIKYELSNREFIEKGWTLLPTTKIMRRMNIYKMLPSNPKSDWFERHKSRGIMFYDTGEKLAEIEADGSGKWYYKNGMLALEYYSSEEANSGHRYVVYSSGEKDAGGRKLPVTVLASFDYLGNGVVYDHYGNERLKYNQSEGVVIDDKIGAPGRWKWHTLNEPPVLQPVFIDTHVKSDICITQLLQFRKDDDKTNDGSKFKREPNLDMLTIELENFMKEKANKLLQEFKPFHIKMKACKVNDQFSLKVLDQSNVYLLFREGQISMKLNLGMILISNEIVDTDTAEVSEVATPYDRHPPKSQSIANMQNVLEKARKLGKYRSKFRD